MKLIILSLFLITALYGFKIYSANKKADTPQENLYKILTIDQWQESLNNPNVTLTENDTDFIHFSTARQVDYVVDKYYKNSSYVILTIDPAKLSGTFKLESNSKGTDSFYHLYDGFIPHEAVTESNIVKQI